MVRIFLPCLAFWQFFIPHCQEGRPSDCVNTYLHLFNRIFLRRSSKSSYHTGMLGGCFFFKKLSVKPNTLHILGKEGRNQRFRAVGPLQCAIWSKCSRIGEDNIKINTKDLNTNTEFTVNIAFFSYQIEGDEVNIVLCHVGFWHHADMYTCVTEGVWLPPE